MKRITGRFFVLLLCALLFTGSAEAGNFSELQGAINGTNEGATLTLSDDYTYDVLNGETGITVEGIIIDKPITIDGANHVVDAMGMARIFKVTGTNVVFKNLTITKGGYAAADSKKGTVSGGGVYVGRNLVVAFDNVKITKCGTEKGVHTKDGGAALFIDAKAKVTFKNCEISENTGKDRAGGIYLIGNAVLENTNIINNICGSRGGGVYVDPGFTYPERGGEWGGNIKMYNCTVSGNRGGRGGGVYINPENETLNIFENCTIASNDVSTDGVGNGGGILFYCANGKAVNCKMVDNKAKRGGGIILDVASNVELENCTVTGNEATVDGSGLYAFDGSHDENVMKRIGEATFKNCIIKGNYVVSGDVKNAQDISINYTDETTAEKRRGVNKDKFPPDGMITEESDPDEYPFWTHELWMARYDGRFTSNGGNTIGKVFRNENIRLAATDKVEAVEPPYSNGSSGCSAASFPLLLLAFGGAAIFFKKR